MGFLDRLLGREKKDESEATDDKMGQEGMHQPAQGMADTGAQTMPDAGADKTEGMAQEPHTEATEQGTEPKNP